MPVRKTTVSIPPEIAQAMDNRNDQFSTAISRSLARYISLLHTTRRALAERFTPGECGLILDSCNGVMFADMLSVRIMEYGIQDSISLDHLDDKWEVDGADLIAKLAALTLVEKIAVIDAVECWWNRVANGEQPEYGELLTGHPDDKLAATAGNMYLV